MLRTGESGAKWILIGIIQIINTRSKKIEKYYGKAYDIEFGIDADLDFPDNVIILQVRPESVWNKKKAENKKSEPTDAMSMILKQLINGVKFSWAWHQ